MVAQSVLFIIAGYETTASLLAFSSFLLAKNKDQQQRLRDELQQMVEEHGGITYQGIMEAKLLDACLQGNTRISFPIWFMKWNIIWYEGHLTRSLWMAISVVG